MCHLGPAFVECCLNTVSLWAAEFPNYAPGEFADDAESR